jgi:hypothetical protein
MTWGWHHVDQAYFFPGSVWQFIRNYFGMKWSGIDVLLNNSSFIVVIYRLGEIGGGRELFGPPITTKQSIPINLRPNVIIPNWLILSFSSNFQVLDSYLLIQLRIMKWQMAHFLFEENNIRDLKISKIFGKKWIQHRSLGGIIVRISVRRALDGDLIPPWDILHFCIFIFLYFYISIHVLFFSFSFFSNDHCYFLSTYISHSFSFADLTFLSHFCLISDISDLLFHIYISYLISHISYIIYHISYIIYHISYIIYHISYIIYHISPTLFVLFLFNRIFDQWDFPIHALNCFMTRRHCFDASLKMMTQCNFQDIDHHMAIWIIRQKDPKLWSQIIWSSISMISFKLFFGIRIRWELTIYIEKQENIKRNSTFW